MAAHHFADNKRRGPAGEDCLECGARNVMSSPDNQPLGSTATDERRLHPRFMVQVQIELRQEASDIPIRAETADLSGGGCYVHVSQTLPPETDVQGKLWLDGSAVKFQGRIVTRHPQFGNGIIFLQFERDGEQVLRRYLDTVAV
jgi:hypothetical protein